MNLTLTQKLTGSAISQLISQAKDAEISRNLELPQEIFKPIWDDIELNPDFSQYEIDEQAELLRLSGYFISNYGKSQNIPQYQERAKNLLTGAIELFTQLELPDRASEAYVILALCYFYEGAISECETILEQNISEYEFDHLHPVYLKTCINRLLVMHWKSEYQKALEVIQEIEIPLEFCQDERLRYMFHTQAGMIFRGIGQYDQAIYHYNQSIKIAQKSSNWVAVANNHNNLAFLYKHIRNFEAAHHHIEISINIFRETNQVGWLPHAIDTKALIYFAENRFEQSLQTIDEAIEIFQKGEDYGVLIDSMWNKVRCFLGLHQKEKAILLFSNLTQIAQAHIGEVAVDKYTTLFSDIIYVKQEDTLENEVRRFKKTEIINTLRQKNFNIEDTAVWLGYATTNKLIKVLNNEFPELYKEIGLQPRVNQPKVKKLSSHSDNDANLQSLAPKLINELHLHKVRLEFDSALRVKPARIKTYYCSAEKMVEIPDISFDAVLAVTPFDQVMTSGELVLIKKSTADYSLAKISHDENLNIFMLMERDMPLSFDEVEIVGKVIGYCAFADVEGDKLSFESLPKI